MFKIIHRYSDFELNYTACMAKVLWYYSKHRGLVLALILEMILTWHLCIIRQPVVGGHKVQAGKNFIRNRRQIATEENKIIFWELTNNIQIFKRSTEQPCLNRPMSSQELCISISCLCSWILKQEHSVHTSVFNPLAFWISYGVATFLGSSLLHIRFVEAFGWNSA
jgi:hypothetical protein